MALTPRRVDNNLRDSYAAGVFPTTVSGVVTDLQAVVHVDENGAPVVTQPISGTVTVSGVATAANQSTEITHLSTIAGAIRAEDSAHSTGQTGVMMLAKRTDTAAQSAGTDGDYCTLNADSNGKLWTNAQVTNTVTTKGEVASGAAVSGTNPIVIALKDLSGNAVIPIGIDASGVTVLGTVPLDLSLHTQDFSSTGECYVNSQTAHDAADAGNPIKIGFKARTSNPTAVSNDDRVNALGDKFGRQVLLSSTLDENKWRAISASDITNTISTAVKSAGGAGVKYSITAITVSNMSASIATRVDILDGSTVIWSGPASAGGGGYSITFNPPLGPLTANTAINAQCGTTGAQVRVAIAGYSES